MNIFILLGAMICACLLSFITAPLLSKKVSRFWLYVINISLGAIIVSVFAVAYGLTEEQMADIVPYLAIILAAVVFVCKKTPRGEEFLQTWYAVDEDADDREYFSQRDMRGKPWWKFMFIPGWITVIIYGGWILGWILYALLTLEPKYLIISAFGFPIVLPVIMLAKKRKRNYDNGYK